MRPPNLKVVRAQEPGGPKTAVPVFVPGLGIAQVELPDDGEEHVLRWDDRHLYLDGEPIITIEPQPDVSLNAVAWATLVAFTIIGMVIVLLIV